MKLFISFIHSGTKQTGSASEHRELNIEQTITGNSRRLFGPEKPSEKLPTACLGKPIF